MQPPPTTNVFSSQYIVWPSCESLQLQVTALHKNYVMNKKKVPICSKKAPGTQISHYIGYLMPSFMILGAFTAFPAEIAMILDEV